ncbi:DUF1622 domain-containing protein [Winogradskyella ursingii]|uniref:DUF1622 domain-containing protein n=1 Tax=Winogradskyella ursingii TaxID=2686079 RepID=UPI0015CB887E|nr:DUF1622 domain-containing protein [Winogradskyella ursingii]
MEEIDNIVSQAAKITEIIGILIIFFGVIYSLLQFLYKLAKSSESKYMTLRISLGKCILLGLEILIAADIMATVVTIPDLKSVVTLGIIVIIRIILSLSIQVELEGKFPWQKEKTDEIL